MTTESETKIPLSAVPVGTFVVHEGEPWQRYGTLPPKHDHVALIWRMGAGNIRVPLDTPVIPLVGDAPKGCFDVPAGMPKWQHGADVWQIDTDLIKRRQPQTLRELSRDLDLGPLPDEAIPAGKRVVVRTTTGELREALRVTDWNEGRVFVVDGPTEAGESHGDRVSQLFTEVFARYADTLNDPQMDDATQNWAILGADDLVDLAHINGWRVRDLSRDAAERLREGFVTSGWTPPAPRRPSWQEVVADEWGYELRFPWDVSADKKLAWSGYRVVDIEELGDVIDQLVAHADNSPWSAEFTRLLDAFGVER